MSQSDARFGYKAKMSRESHDLSRSFGFTSCPGFLSPIFADIASPGDTYYIQHDLDFLRTGPLAAPAMVDVKVHYETFFVPFQMIYQVSENTIFSLNNVQSSHYNRTMLQNSVFPLFDMSYYVNDLLANYATSSYRFEAFRLFDLLGLNPLSILPSSSWDYKPSFFPWQILAYNTIWHYYFRLDDKTQFNNAVCNWDNRYGSSSPVQLAGNSTTVKLHRRPWKFDYFTSMYRSPIVSNDNMQSILPYAQYSQLTQSEVAPVGAAGQVTGIINSDVVGFTPRTVSTYNNGAYQRDLMTATIRQLFANEKLAMITGRTKKNYDSQVLAHYGVNVPHDVKHDLTLIGHDEYQLRVGEVTSLASTSDAPLGELAGKGWASGQGKKHKFTCPVHGVVMTLFSIEPIQRYTVGFERQNSVVNAFDLPVPEFDRLGNVPMFRYETGIQLTGTQLFTDLIGWKERYYQWKRRSNRVTVAFMGVPGSNLNQYVNNYAAYMLVNQPFGGTPASDTNFYIAPNVLDNLMLVHYVNTWHTPQSETDTENWNMTPWLAYARDSFIVDSYEKVTKVSWMSKDGEPIYPY